MHKNKGASGWHKMAETWFLFFILNVNAVLYESWLVWIKNHKSIKSETETRPILETIMSKIRPLKISLESENNLQDQYTLFFFFFTETLHPEKSLLCQWRLVHLHLEVDTPPAQTHLWLAAQSVDQSGVAKVSRLKHWSCWAQITVSFSRSACWRQRLKETSRASLISSDLMWSPVTLRVTLTAAWDAL